jgi:hypothetical protein
VDVRKSSEADVKKPDRKVFSKSVIKYTSTNTLNKFENVIEPNIVTYGANNQIIKKKAQFP